MPVSDKDKYMDYIMETWNNLPRHGGATDLKRCPSEWSPFVLESCALISIPIEYIGTVEGFEDYVWFSVGKTKEDLIAHEAAR